MLSQRTEKVVQPSFLNLSTIADVRIKISTPKWVFTIWVKISFQH